MCLSGSDASLCWVQWWEMSVCISCIGYITNTNPMSQVFPMAQLAGFRFRNWMGSHDSYLHSCTLRYYHLAISIKLSVSSLVVWLSLHLSHTVCLFKRVLPPLPPLPCPLLPLHMYFNLQSRWTNMIQTKDLLSHKKLQQEVWKRIT